jgi:hypothetical protein
MQGSFEISYGITEDNTLMIKICGFEKHSFPGKFLFCSHFASRHIPILQSEMSYMLDPNMPEHVFIMPYVSSPGINLVPQKSAYVRIPLSSVSFADELTFNVPVSAYILSSLNT